MARRSELKAMVLFAASALSLAAAGASAQDIRVRLVDDSTRRPLAGALVSAIGRGAAGGPSSLTAANGIATVRIAVAAPVRLLVRRIGFAPFTTDVIHSPPDGEILDVVVPARRITLRTVRVVASQACTAKTESPSSEALVAWTEVRTALEASELTREQRLVTTRAFRFQRQLTLNGRAEGSDSVDLGAAGERPFFAPSLALLEREGYFKQHDDESEDFYAPDENVLLSDAFVRRHCIVMYPDVHHDSTGSQLALAFFPRDNDSRPEIRGLIWIDSATAELRRVDFQYARLSLPARVDSLGGSVEFAHLESGAWIVASWTMRMPRWKYQTFGGGTLYRQLELRGYTEVGGSASVEHDIADASLVARSIAGQVYDSVAHRPLGGAHVHLADIGRDVVADSTGRFRFDSVGAGEHELWADHPLLDTLGLFTLVARVEAGAESVDAAALAIPSFETLWIRACGGRPPAADAHTGFVYGRIRSNVPPSRPPTVAIESPRAGSRAGDPARGGAPERHTAQADRDGNYSICGVPTGQTVTIGAKSADTTTIPVSFQIGSHRIARRDLTLPSSASTHEAFLADTSSLPALPPADGATVAGIVRDSAGQPVRDARVTVSGVKNDWRTNERGAFILRGIPAGTRVVAVRALGFLQEGRLIDFTATDSAYVDVPLTRLITRLGTITVKERRRFDALHSMLDSHRRLGTGYFVDSLDVQKFNDISQAFNFPRVQVVHTQAKWYIQMRSGILTMGGGEMCTPTVWIDNFVADFDMLNDLTKDEIGLIEVYATAAEAGLEYTGTRSNCGVVLVWRKRFISP